VPESLTCAGLSSRPLDNSEEGTLAGTSPVRGSARGASVIQLCTALGYLARLQGTTLVHTSQSGERQVIDFIGDAGATRQSLPALRAKSNISACSGLSDAHSPPPRSTRQWYTGPHRLVTSIRRKHWWRGWHRRPGISGWSIWICQRRCRKNGARNRIGQGSATNKSIVLPRRALQRVGLPRRVDVFWGRSAADKVMVIVPPIAAFVAAGFEHSVANLYFLPYGLAIKYWAGPEFWSSVGSSATDYAALSAVSATHNIVVATIGNLIGGSPFVGAVYWFVYLRRR
jgi:Formate/nitrite transporter